MTEPTTAPEDETALARIVEFLRAAEAMKVNKRSGWTSTGERESVAEHTWRLTLAAMVLGPRLGGVNVARLLELCVVHDLGEAIGGDVPAPEQAARGSKAADERRDLIAIASLLPDAERDRVIAAWEEYEDATTPESRAAKALDKLETLLQHVQGDNPTDFDLRWNLGYARKHTMGDPVVVRLRAMLDAETERRATETDARTAAPGSPPSAPEVWLRGALPGVEPLWQPVAHSLLQCREEVARLLAAIDDDAIRVRPAGGASAGYHLAHAIGSLDRLLTYARGEQLSEAQRSALAAETNAPAPNTTAVSLASAFGDAVDRALSQLRATPPDTALHAREVGRGRLPSTVLGLLFHAAEHTQRHVGQATTTARVVVGKR